MRTRLRELAQAVLAEELGATSIGRLCPRCGSAEHGRPYAVTPGRRAPQVSMSYAAGLVAVAWADEPVGIDVEADGSLVQVADLLEWTRHEALFKAGLETPTTVLELPSGYVGTVAGREVSWRLAGPAAPDR